jgi:endonuclease YncB( thermonuclease family)
MLDSAEIRSCGMVLSTDSMESRCAGKDQECLSEQGAVWACGTEVRERLEKMIGDRIVRCEDRGTDSV